MKNNISKKLAKRKRKIHKKLSKRNWENQSKPMLKGGNIHYDVDGRHQAISNGGIGNIHQLSVQTGLIDEIDKGIRLLKRHLPYHESDHILNIAYNYSTCAISILLQNQAANLNGNSFFFNQT